MSQITDGINALIARRDRILKEIGSNESQRGNPDYNLITNLVDVSTALMFLAPEYQGGTSGGTIPGATATLKWYGLSGTGTETIVIPSGATMQGIEVSVGSVSFTGAGTGRLVAPYSTMVEVDYYGQTFDETSFSGETNDTIFNVFYKIIV